MSTIEKSAEVDVPLHTAYNQWTQVESFPQFMEGVEEVQQIDDVRSHWKTRIAGTSREFDAEIIEQIPDRRIAWHSVEGPDQVGVVTFEPIDDERTRVSLTMDFNPQGIVEKVGDATDLVERRVEGDLRRFKEFIESRGTETGAWRGNV